MPAPVPGWRMPARGTSVGGLAALAETGHADRLLLGGDATTPDAPGVPHLLSHLRPRIERELGAEVAGRILRENPARAFATSWR